MTKSLSIPPSVIRWVAVVFTLALALAAAFIYGLGPALIVLATGALLLGISLLWTSVQNLTGETPLTFEEALTLGAPTAEEEQKRAVLRALKDLEYEQSVGKITPEDYQELSARYRAEAKRLMQSLDEHLGPARQRAERLLNERLSRAGLGPQSPAHAEAKAAPAEAPESARTTDEPEEQPESVRTREEAAEVKS